MCVDLLFYCGEEKRKSTCTRKMHTTKFTCNKWRPPTAIQVVLCSHSEALVIDPKQLRWLEVS